jgi:amino acid permease
MGVFDNFNFGDDKEKEAQVVSHNVDFGEGEVAENRDDLQRRLGNRQIQLLAIGGTIGTALFVSIGGALNKVCHTFDIRSNLVVGLTRFLNRVAQLEPSSHTPSTAASWLWSTIALLR